MWVKTIFGFLVTAHCCFLLSCTLQINDSHPENGSDELSITANYCGPKFLCHLTGHCVFYSWVCDNVSDCIGGEDEANCESNVCPEGYHRCNQTGQCVPYKWICEGSFMCPGHSGPLPCANYTCPLGKFKCTSGRCIPNYLICDGDPDCDDGSDETEQMCAIYCSSSTGKYLCAGGRKCISTMSQCDLIYDCPQMDDEYNCSID